MFYLNFSVALDNYTQVSLLYECPQEYFKGI